MSSAIRERDPAYLTEWKPFLGLLALLLRFYEPCKGQVTFGGRDSRSIPLKELRSRCAYVSQDPQLFEGTIRWNLCRELTLPACVAAGEVRRGMLITDTPLVLLCSGSGERRSGDTRSARRGL